MIFSLHLTVEYKYTINKVSSKVTEILTFFLKLRSMGPLRLLILMTSKIRCNKRILTWNFNVKIVFVRTVFFFLQIFSDLEM